MADIIQLEEKGVKQYLATHVKAVEGLDKELEESAEKMENLDKRTKNVEDLLKDTGWKNFAGKNTAFYRVMNNVLYIKFVDHNPVDSEIGSLPVAYSPETGIMIDVAGWNVDGATKARLQINERTNKEPGKVAFVSRNVDKIRTCLPGIPLG